MISSLKKRIFMMRKHIPSFLRVFMSYMTEWNYCKKEEMDFQTHLYELGEMELYLKDIGFKKINVYSSYDKVIAENNQTEMFLYECSL